MQHLKDLTGQELYEKALFCKDRKNFRYMKKLSGQAIQKGYVPAITLLECIILAMVLK